MQHHSQYPSTFYRTSLKAIIRNEKGDILMCKEYASDSYGVPGGGWEHGESEQECLARELNEEVGYTGEFTSRPVATAVWWLESRRAWLLWIVYEVETATKDFHATDDCHDVAFVPVESLKDSTERDHQWVYNYLTAAKND